MSGMLELAARCEKTSGRDRFLGREVLLACGKGFVSPLYPWLDPTASLDAALTLVPEGWHWSLYDTNGSDIGPAAVAQLEPPEYSSAPIEGQAATIALSVCAAALRSIASMKEGGV
jgi:hypothetical protein